MNKTKNAPVGLPPRAVALIALRTCLDQRRPLDEALESPALSKQLSALEDRDRRLCHALVRACLRHLGQIDDLLATFIDKPLPERSGPTQHILRLALTELLFLKTQAHAATNIAVDMAAADVKAKHFRGLVNAVCRRAIREGEELLEIQKTDEVLLPAWLMEGWYRAYGVVTASALIIAHTEEPSLDITLKPELNAEEWAAKLEARILPNGSLRGPSAGAVQDLPGFAEGAWWVQDAAATLPARMLGDVRGQTVLDLCAAPGGKTAWLAASGANVIAVDKSETRLARVRENLKRLNLSAECVAADVRTYTPPTPAMAILLDAPCSATGTIRRHPDLPWIKEPDDIRALGMLQSELLGKAFQCLAPGGTLVYATCSLEPEEGPEVIAEFLKRTPQAARKPVMPGEIQGADEFITTDGDIRTLPCHWPEHGGLDGFFACRIIKNTE